MAKSNRYKTYPFPYLAEYTKDYKKTRFTLGVNHKTEQGKLKIQLDYVLTNAQLTELIKAGIIQVAIKIVCPTMGFSEVVTVSSSSNTITCSYSTMKFDDDIGLKGYLVAKKPFVLENDDLSEEWKNDKATVMENNVIGETNERVITINHLKSGSSKSIFQFTRDLSKDELSPYSYSLSDQNSIVFKLSTKAFNIFESLRRKEEGKQFIYVFYIIPVLSDILRQMINTEVDDDGEIVTNDFNLMHSNKKWYMVLCDNYRKAFDDKDPTVSGQVPPLEAAQQIIDRYAVYNSLVRSRKIMKEGNR